MVGKKANGRTGTDSTGTGTVTDIGFGTAKYNPNDFQIPARDHQGHSVRLWCNVQPTVDHEINAIMGSKNWPFKVKGDFVRWCVWEGVKRISKMKSASGSMIVVAETIMESCKAANQWLKFKASVDATEDTVKALMDSGNETEAYKLLSGLKVQVQKLEEASWRDQWMGEFQKRFGHLFDRAKKTAISLSASSQE